MSITRSQSMPNLAIHNSASEEAPTTIARGQSLPCIANQESSQARVSNNLETKPNSIDSIFNTILYNPHDVSVCQASETFSFSNATTYFGLQNINPNYNQGIHQLTQHFNEVNTTIEIPLHPLLIGTTLLTETYNETMRDILVINNRTVNDITENDMQDALRITCDFHGTDIEILRIRSERMHHNNNT